MPLELDSRVCGPIHVVSAKGLLVAGPECGQLEAILNLDSRRHLKQVVLEVSGLDRLDSLGLGLIVRTAASLRRRNGDLRLANPTPVITQLLELTRVASILNAYPTDEAAILSFLENEPAPAASNCTGCCIMIVDRSPDFVAFVATLLAQHNCDVKLAGLLSDAKILLRFQPVDTILIGSGPMPAANMALTLQTVAPKAKILTLDPTLHTREAHEAAEEILQMLQSHGILPAQA